MDEVANTDANLGKPVPNKLTALFNDAGKVHVQALPCAIPGLDSKVVHFGTGARTVPHRHAHGQLRLREGGRGRSAARSTLRAAAAAGPVPGSTRQSARPSAGRDRRAFGRGLPAVKAQQHVGCHRRQRQVLRRQPPTQRQQPEPVGADRRRRVVPVDQIRQVLVDLLKRFSTRPAQHPPVPRTLQDQSLRHAPICNACRPTRQAFPPPPPRLRHPRERWLAG